MSEFSIRPYRAADWVGVWAVLEPVFRAGETYAVAPDISEAQAEAMWTVPPREAFVAVDERSDEILGTYFLKPNHGGPGGHVCNAGYVVREQARGRGVASRLCEHSQDVALERGFEAMQYNLVAASNVGAVRLWGRMGFEVVGTLPGAFRHPQLGLVDAFVMYKLLVGSRDESGTP